MDGFKEKLVKQCGTDDIIRANSEAEAKEFQEVKEELKNYEAAAAEIRRLYLKCVETNEQTGQLVAETIEKLESISSDNTSGEGMAKEQEEFIHKENVRVYRNVQASIVEELELQTQALADQNSDLKKQIKKLKGTIVTSVIFSVLSFASIAALIVLFLLDIKL